MGSLKPVKNRFPWIAGGLLLEVVGAAVPAIYMFTKAKHESLGGSITRATIRLVWHESLHSRTGIAILIGGAVVFAAGAVALARPYSKHVVVLIVGVPVAAIAGLLLLGVFALVIAFVVAAAEGLDIDLPTGGGGGSTDGTGWWGSWGSGRRRSKEEEQPQQQDEDQAAAYQAFLPPDSRDA
ncbi:MAG: hypothetical protein ACYDHH_10430 [Solirubrobacteraceae bacterium]